MHCPLHGSHSAALSNVTWGPGKLSDGIAEQDRHRFLSTTNKARRSEGEQEFSLSKYPSSEQTHMPGRQGAVELVPRSLHQSVTKLKARTGKWITLASLQCDVLLGNPGQEWHHDKISRHWPGLQIPQIPIRWSICGTRWNKFDPWRPYLGNHRTQSTHCQRPSARNHRRSQRSSVHDSKGQSYIWSLSRVITEMLSIEVSYKELNDNVQYITGPQGTVLACWLNKWLHLWQIFHCFLPGRHPLASLMSVQNLNQLAWPWLRREFISLTIGCLYVLVSACVKGSLSCTDTDDAFKDVLTGKNI